MDVKDIDARFDELLAFPEISYQCDSGSQGTAVPVNSPWGVSNNICKEVTGPTAQMVFEEAFSGPSFGRVVLDRWSAFLQKDEAEGVLVFISGVPVGSDAMREPVVCNAPVQQRITSHHLVLRDATQVALCGAPEEEPMEQARVGWLIPSLLNGFPVDWQQIVRSPPLPEAGG
eukprot:CAMPEP_0177624228 /NCGR_PEP_ID=MMETSP0419_2-20121207/29369_1 /TAXON_ID=582737 /ORGANISM="Tetraselmis sp., Strain GSL018" /LENGTH=172 /DNA_ID=CAMNT_0019124923 /DNA_START=333 /DNA_END=847 /DNA_ORIENTATION=+